MRFLFALAAAGALAVCSPAARAQHNHAQGHAFYQNWTNQQGRGCCNDQDCGQLEDKDERTVAGQLEVRIEGQWCPVKPEHYLSKGNAPDWSTAHVCVTRNWTGRDETGAYYEDKRSPCERLLCYQPKPGG